MRSKRLLAFLMVLCLVISAAAPAATAVTHEKKAAFITEKKANSDHVSAMKNDLLVGGESATKIPSLRGQTQSQNSETDQTSQKGTWFVTPSDVKPSVERPAAQLPACVAELREAAKIYADNQVVSAFVVMEEAPLIQFYGINDVPVDEEALLQMQQEAVVMLIEEDVLGGETLQVTDQFTYVTNSIVIETEFGNLSAIAQIPGVKSVFLTPVYQACTTTASPYTVSAGNMSNVNDVWNNENLGYTGTGMTIAVIDTGIDMDHPSFAADPAMNEYSWDVSYVASRLDKLNAKLITPGITAEKLFYSNKIPFTFNYVTGKTNVNHDPDTGDHGSHVAGIAAANDIPGSNVVGMAPDAQLVIMQVFTPGQGAQLPHILAALEDAMALECDVANLSLGSPAGFTSTDPEIDAIYQRIADSDIIVDIAAGNEGVSSYENMWGTNLNLTDHIDNATISSPATYTNAMAVGSIDNKIIPGAYFTLADGSSVFYMDSVEYLYGQTGACLANLAGEALEYVIVPGLGTVEDYAQVDVSGKIAIVRRGEISFAEKALNGEAAGAVAVIIWNQNNDYIFNFGMTTAAEDGTIPSIPVSLITLADGESMETAETKTMTVSEETGFRADIYGGQVSEFSSWGVSPDLRLVPDIAGVGGNVYSCYDNGQYGLMSGTSMASPQVAGVTALVLQYLREQFPDATEAEVRVLLDSLLMSTAVPTIADASGVEASPRQQGAGLVNALNAVTTGAYLSVDGSNRPKAELFDNANGTYTFTFRIHNFSANEMTYTLSSSLLTEDFVEIDGEEYMAGYDRALSGTVAFSHGTVTVAAGSTVPVTVTISLSAEDKAWMAEHFVNGNYVEGYIYLTAAKGVNLNLPFLGFYGSWDAAPVFDTAYWYQNNFWGIETAIPDGNEYFHAIWTDLQGTEWVLGFNPYFGAFDDENGNIIYDPANNVISNNGDGLADYFSEVYLSLMRNAKEVTFTFTDEEGHVVYEETSLFVEKTMYISAFGQIVPYLRSWWYTEPYDFTDENGDPLPHGTKLTLTVSGVLDYEGAETDYLKQIPLTLDTQAPSVVGNGVETASEEGNFVTITVSDHALAYVALMNPQGTRVLGEYGDPNFVKNDDGTYTVTLDVTGMGNEFTVLLGDYGCNESVFDLTFSAANDPEVDESALYAYRIHDSFIEENFGYDSMFGWVTIGKEDAAVTDLTNDRLEYYALTAAEYAGGYIFAVDAGYNLVVLEPGLWNRKLICNLGVSVADMTFDETTGTMYLSARAENRWGDEVGCLYTMDLLTGQLEMVAMYDSVYDIPYAMTAVDGTIYAVKNSVSSFYKMDMETYELVAVTDGDGNDVVLTTSEGQSIAPYYAQSMTYSNADGKIYWAYVSYSGLPHLFAIDPTDMSYTSVPFATDSEYVGLLVLEDDGYTLPESENVEALVISSESLLLVEGEEATLTASPLPWNAPVGELTWTSTDESVATVDEKGVVTGISEGYTEIIVSDGQVEAYCAVNVVKIQGQLYAYNYYNGTEVYGDWFTMDLAEMKMESLYASPVDFVAADYNGHDGMIYGYDANYQAYRFDPATGEAVALGMPVNAMIMDMAYDYSTGFMYAISIDQMAWTTTLHYVNMNTGALTEVAKAPDVYMTLACDTDGGLYAVSAEGILYYLLVMEDMWGGGIMPWSGAEAAVSMIIEPTFIMEGFASLQYQQSMCFDHNTYKLIWTQPEAGTIYWIDPFAMEPYAVSLGDPTGTRLIEFTGMYTIPAEIPELAYVSVEDAYAEDLLVMVGGEKLPDFTVAPLNATNQSVVWTSADESVATVTENGTILGVSEGTTTVTGILNDEGNEIQLTFTVTVKPSAGNIYGFILTDIATYGGLVWAQIPDTDPNYPLYLAATNYTIYSEEYVDGAIYAYGLDGDDWQANWQFMTIDPDTFEILEMKDLGEGFPFVYDITYDYVTGTMYALAGPDEVATDLYMVNMANGALIPVMEIEPFFMSIAAAPDGTIYAMASSEETMDPDTWEVTSSNAVLYTIDVENGTYEPAFDTGIKSNMFASMTFDFTTGSLYWTALYQGGTYVGGLHLIDLEGQKAYNLGNIGSGGSQVSGLFTISDPEVYPAGPDALQNVSLMSQKESLCVGESVQLETFIQPAGIDVDISWASSDENVATVDENGVVTAVAPGVAQVTVTVTDGENTFTATCVIIVYDVTDYLLSYNTTDHGWAQISRQDSTVVTAANTDDENVLAVRSAAIVDGVIYGYDVENGFFTTTKESGYVRNYIGQGNYVTNEDVENVKYYYEVRDMAWDGQRMLAVVCESVEVTDVDWDGEPYTVRYEMDEGCGIYEVNLENGELTFLCAPQTMDGYAMSNVYAIAVDYNGTVYIYSSFDDYISTLDVETGATVRLNSLSRLNIYGGSDGEPMAMVYDPVTCDLYLLMTQNGNYYRLFRMDSKTYGLSEVGNVGETEYNASAWATFGDSFASLVVDAEHIHAWTEWVTITEATDDAAGLKEHKCLLCGEVETEEIPATGTEPTDPTDPEVTEPDTTDPEETQKPTEKPGTGDNVQTGDEFNPVIWIVIMVVALVLVVVLFFLRKKLDK